MISIRVAVSALVLTAILLTAAASSLLWWRTAESISRQLASTINEQIVAAREPQWLPVVLSGEEIVRFLEAVPGLRNRVALTTAYGAGLRVGEVVRLTASAIDSSRMLIRFEQGKGAKDRYVMLSPRLLALLRDH